MSRVPRAPFLLLTFLAFLLARSARLLVPNSSLLIFLLTSDWCLLVHYALRSSKSVDDAMLAIEHQHTRLDS